MYNISDLFHLKKTLENHIRFAPEKNKGTLNVDEAFNASHK